MSAPATPTSPRTPLTPPVPSGAPSEPPVHPGAAPVLGVSLRGTSLETSLVESAVAELTAKLAELEARYLGPSSPAPCVTHSPFAPLPFSRTSFDVDLPSSTISKLPSIPLPSFEGSNLEQFHKEFSRFVRLTGLSSAEEHIQKDWLILCCHPKIKPLIEKVCCDQRTLSEVFSGLHTLFPSLESDLTLRSKI